MERVLLVEDELDELEILYWMIVDQGCDVRTANTAKAAVSLGKLFRPTLLVTDFLLSHDVTGIDVIRELRKADPSLPALLITAAPAADWGPAVAALGNVDVIQKPFTRAAFLGRLESMKRAA